MEERIETGGGTHEWCDPEDLELAASFMDRYREVAAASPHLTPDEAWAAYQNECLYQMTQHLRRIEVGEQEGDAPMMERIARADERDIEPIEVGEWVRVTRPRRPFEMAPGGFTGQITEIEEPEQVTNPHYRRKSSRVWVKPKNPYRETEPVEVALVQIKVWRNRDGTKAKAS